MTQEAAAGLLVFIGLLIASIWGCLLSERKWKVSKLEIVGFWLVMVAFFSPGLSLLFFKAILG